MSTLSLSVLPNLFIVESLTRLPRFGHIELRIEGHQALLICSDSLYSSQRKILNSLTIVTGHRLAFQHSDQALQQLTLKNAKDS